jgi:site-specific DNA recombinase
MNKKVVCYARFSSSKQREESITIQLEKINEYCRSHNLEIVGQYIDEAQSGTSDRRTNFQKLIRDAEEHLWDYVVVYKMDRFSRSVSDALHYQKILQGHGIEILSVIEDFDNETPEGGFFNLITMGMSQLYVQNLRRSVMAGLFQNAKRAMATGGIPPLGYQYNAEKILEINPIEAEIVRIIFDMAANGNSYAEIALRLNNESRSTKIGKPFNANFTDILKNRKYIGEYVYNRSTSKSSDGKRNNHNNKAEFEIIRIPNSHPRIVDQQTFIKVQEILRRRQFRKGQSRLKSKYMLAGRIRCSACGKAFFGDVSYGGRNKKPRFRYLCGSKSTTPCLTKDLNMGSMDGFVIEFLHRYILNTKMSKQWLEITKDTLDRFKLSSREKLKELKAKALQKEKEIDNLIQKTGEARRNSERLIVEQIRSLDIEQANLSTEANAMEIELSRLIRPTQKNITKFMKDALSTLKKDPQLIARNFIKRIIAGTSEVTFEFDLRHFAGVENLIFDIVIPVVVPRELIVKSKFLTWDYDFKQVNYRPKVESSRVKLLSEKDLPQS